MTRALLPLALGEDIEGRSCEGTALAEAALHRGDVMIGLGPKAPRS